MKKLLFIVLFIPVAVLPAFSQPEYRNEFRGVLKVRLADNYPITIAIDGWYFQKHGPSLTIGDLPAGKHFLKIYTFTPNNGGEARAHLVYEGKVKIFEDVITSVVFDQNSGELHVDREERQNMQEPAPERVRGRQQIPYSESHPGFEKASAPETKPVEEITVPEAKLTKPSYAQISKDAFDKLGNKINAKITDTDKLKDLQSALAKKAMSAEQLKVMLTWLSFESSRVEFAKWAFPNITDKKNFTGIISNMKYQESKEELNKFLLQ